MKGWGWIGGKGREERRGERREKEEREENEVETEFGGGRERDLRAKAHTVLDT